MLATKAVKKYDGEEMEVKIRSGRSAIKKCRRRNGREWGKEIICHGAEQAATKVLPGMNRKCRRFDNETKMEKIFEQIINYIMVTEDERQRFGNKRIASNIWRQTVCEVINLPEWEGRRYGGESWPTTIWMQIEIGLHIVAAIEPWRYGNEKVEWSEYLPNGIEQSEYGNE